MARAGPVQQAEDMTIHPGGGRLTRILVAAAGMLGGVLTPVAAPAAISRPGGPPVPGLRLPTASWLS